MRGDLDEVEVRLLGKAERIGGGNDADGLATGANESDLGNPDPVVDSKLGADVSSCGQVSGRTCPRNRRRLPLVHERKPVVPRHPEGSRTTEGPDRDARGAYAADSSGPDPTTCAREAAVDAGGRPCCASACEIGHGN